jgi:hypothetical protein
VLRCLNKFRNFLFHGYFHIFLLIDYVKGKLYFESLKSPYTDFIEKMYYFLKTGNCRLVPSTQMSEIGSLFSCYTSVVPDNEV